MTPFLFLFFSFLIGFKIPTELPFVTTSGEAAVVEPLQQGRGEQIRGRGNIVFYD